MKEVRAGALTFKSKSGLCINKSQVLDPETLFQLVLDPVQTYTDHDHKEGGAAALSKLTFN